MIDDLAFLCIERAGAETPLVTAAVGWCPAYVPFGFSTRPKQK